MSFTSFNGAIDMGSYASPGAASASLAPGGVNSRDAGPNRTPGQGGGGGGGGGGGIGVGGGPSPYAQHYPQYPYQQQQQHQQQQQQAQPQQHHYSSNVGGGLGAMQSHLQQQQQLHHLALGGAPTSTLNHGMNAPSPGMATTLTSATASATRGGLPGGLAVLAGAAPSTSNPNTALSVYHLITQLCQRPEPGATGASGDIGGSAGASAGASAVAGTPASTHASTDAQAGMAGSGAGGASPTATSTNASEHPATSSKTPGSTTGSVTTVAASTAGTTTGANPLTGLPHGEAGSSPLREHALLELSKRREQYDDLALVLWHSFGVMSSLLQEIIAVYPMLSPPTLTAHASNRVCNALALLQCVASHAETRSLFLQAYIPLFLYPFLNTTSKTRPFEYLRLTSLGVIGALVKQNDNSAVITFLLSTEIIPLCLRIMETGLELSKTVAIFIVQKILLDDTGLSYVCQTYERFYAVGTVLANMVAQIVETQAVRLLKHVVRCYLRLSDNPRAREALRACLPGPLRDTTFAHLLKNDHITKRCLATLLLNLSDRVE